jgi:homoserine dehydrogenase
MTARLRIALYGTGQVGRAVLDRLECLRPDGVQLVHVENTRHHWSDPAAGPAHVVLDATASDAIAARHADWLARGVHVVTANKLGQGASLARWRAIREACHSSGARHGDSATVGAGLPLLRTVRALQRGGDAIHAVSGVLSGSIAWLLSRYDGSVPFSHCVREAREAGFTEPDPRLDLSGEDVRRKLLILARAAGAPLEACDIDVDALSTPALHAATSASEIDAALVSLDVPMRERFAHAQRSHARLHLVARWSHDAGASVRIEALPAAHPLAAGQGTDNRLAIHSARYAMQPLVIQGPGAGAAITAAAMLDDVFAIRDAVRGLQVGAVTRTGASSAKNDSIDCGRLIA